MAADLVAFEMTRSATDEDEVEKVEQKTKVVNERYLGQRYFLTQGNSGCMSKKLYPANFPLINSDSLRSN